MSIHRFLVLHGSNDVGTDTKRKMKIIVIIIKRINEFIYGATYA